MVRSSRLPDSVASPRGETEAPLVWETSFPRRPLSDSPADWQPDFPVPWPGSGSHPPLRGPQQARWLRARVGRAAPPPGPAPAPGGGGGRINIEGGGGGKQGTAIKGIGLSGQHLPSVVGWPGAPFRPSRKRVDLSALGTHRTQASPSFQAGQGRLCESGHCLPHAPPPPPSRELGDRCPWPPLPHLPLLALAVFSQWDDGTAPA